MSIIDKACAWAKAIAFDDAHGYDQGSRWGPDYDCSSLVISAWKQADVPLTATYTGNMRADMLAHGFRDVTAQVNQYTGAGLERGDVLLHERNHTALYIGAGQIVNAGGNERGGANGGRTGDQTGREIAVIGYYRPSYGWDCVLRYVEEETGQEAPSSAGQSPAPGEQGTLAGQTPRENAGPPSPQGEGNYSVRPGDSLWGIAERELGDGFRFEELRALNDLDGYVIYPGQVLKLPGKDPSAAPQDDTKEPATEQLTLRVRTETGAALRRKAKAAGCSVGEWLDKHMEEA